MKTGARPIRLSKFLWPLGFLGFLGFTYFRTGYALWLFSFSYFSFFAYYFIGKMADEMPDERYMENNQKAKLKVFRVAVVALFLIGFFAGFSFVTKEMIIIACALGWSAALIGYAFLFWHYDKH
ncbi:MAG: DUF3796 domain-containing protein [Bacillota bacterium]|mgnify:CR=1 FL=1|jgi:protein-S-isoprenylcysteine O-methyltransferase Ste14|nr:DUF3796 domain-containing protein [Bacillota bacterium]NLU55789.1 DUF3796 domain-containing protein [Bacillota bacterium]HOA90724.1 DUF3796 domain-containing protein [Bacillota bacterium]HOJ46289.1 DUF3796 domain-containing protein [Bacillota bacterium]HOL12759.1 DUF3796 domain-containing protein [Bacillota bacterium]